MLTAAFVFCVIAFAYGDIYMHNPRGSNNRLDTNNNAGNVNGDRLFDSQNNANGGYDVGPPLTFYEGSWLTVEWTAQHACGNDEGHCQIILQYMCSLGDAKDTDVIRDGTTNNGEIPNSPEHTLRENGELVYGMHEPQMYYHECSKRKRNKGLFIADRNVGATASARATRQSNGDGNNKNGFECNEERDYYPYWHPSPWRDIAILTTDPSMCAWYQQESQNVKNKGHCVYVAKTADEEPTQADMDAALTINNRAECEVNEFSWVEDGAHGLAPPECLQAPWSRQNHLGNAVTDTLSGHMAHYNWSLPTRAELPCIEFNNCNCVLRIRYNISTFDYEGRASMPNMADSTKNGDGEEALIMQDPMVTVSGIELALAINTDQYGRTFQDRSHVFHIRRRPDHLNFGQRIFNVNVRGKRGNIVQTYPAVEYDFVPTYLVVREYDHVHFQWTGYDDQGNNGDNNAEGTDDTDRSNIVQIASMGHNYPVPDDDVEFNRLGIPRLFERSSDRRYFAFLDQSNCIDYATLLEQENNNRENADKAAGNCAKLNNVPSPYFDSPVLRMNQTGTFHYMSTRNNNFSNRNHRASITVVPILTNTAIVATAAGGALMLSSIAIGAMIVKAKQNPMGRLAQYFDRV